MTSKDRAYGRYSFISGTTDGTMWPTGRPLSTDGCLIMFCENGSAEFSINSRSYTQQSGCLTLITFDMVVVPVSVSDDFKARFLSIDFDATQDLFFLVTSNRLWDFIYKSPVCALSDTLVRAVARWYDTLGWISANCSDAIRDRMMRREAENFMTAMTELVETRLGSLGDGPQKNRAWALTNDFIALLNRHYARHHDVAFYAGRLNVTPNYLNIISKRNTGTTAKEQINLQIGLVVRMLLDTTDLSVKQIASRLHYDDPSYLCRIFRKQTGMSPLQYRHSTRPIGSKTQGLYDGSGSVKSEPK